MFFLAFYQLAQLLSDFLPFIALFKQLVAEILETRIAMNPEEGANHIYELERGVDTTHTTPQNIKDLCGRHTAYRKIITDSSSYALDGGKWNLNDADAELTKHRTNARNWNVEIDTDAVLIGPEEPLEKFYRDSDLFFLTEWNNVEDFKADNTVIRYVTVASYLARTTSLNADCLVKKYAATMLGIMLVLHYQRVHSINDNPFKSQPGWLITMLKFEVDEVDTAVDLEIVLFDDLSDGNKFCSLSHILLSAMFLATPRSATYVPKSGLALLNAKATLTYVEPCADNHHCSGKTKSGVKMCMCSLHGLEQYSHVTHLCRKVTGEAGIRCFRQLEHQSIQSEEGMLPYKRWVGFYDDRLLVRSTLLRIIVYVQFVLAVAWPLCLEFISSPALSNRNIDTVGAIFASLALAAGAPQLYAAMFGLDGTWKELIRGQYRATKLSVLKPRCKLCLLQDLFLYTRYEQILSPRGASFLLSASGNTEVDIDYTVRDLTDLGYVFSRTATGKRSTMMTALDLSIRRPVVRRPMVTEPQKMELHVDKRHAFITGRLVDILHPTDPVH